MAYLTLYRKYRPQTFDELVGQKHVARTLRRAVAAGKVAHAYLFSGPRGTGKTSTARLLAKALDCERGPTPSPDDTCEMCRAISAGTAMDVIEMDAASNRGIDEIRALRERIHFAPTQGSHKVYIVDEVHMLTAEAFSALLKALEEPPEHTVFVLCTTEPHRVPKTIASRCQRFDFRRLALPDVLGRLEWIAAQEGIRIDPGALRVIARSAQGSMRDAISTLDQLSAFSEEGISAEDVASLLGVVEQELLFALASAVADGDSGAVLRLAAQAIEEGHDPAAILRELLGHFRDLYVTRAAGDAPGVLDVTPETHKDLVDQSRRFDERGLERIMAALSDAQADLRGTVDARLVMEAAFVRITRPPAESEDLSRRIDELERRVRVAGVAVAEEPVAAAPEREAPGPPAPLTTEGIQSNWAAFLEALGDPRLRGPLMSSEPTVEGDELVIAVDDKGKKLLLDEPAKHEALKAGAARVFGRGVTVRVEVGGGPARRQAERTGEDGYHARLKRHFDAEKVTEIRKTGDS